MIEHTLTSTRRAVLALATALCLCATALVLFVAGPAHASTPAAAPKCPSKTYFLHKLNKRYPGTRRIDSKKCAGQWAGVIASSRNTYNSLFQHTTGNNWVYRPRNTKNCRAIPKKLDYICQGS